MLRPEAERIVRLLDLAPHPEGGYYRETYRDSLGPADRGFSTAIYFLLAEGQISRWHRVDATEIWHWYDGAPLLLSIAAPGAAKIISRLGPNFAHGEEPQLIVPAGHWQQAASLGAYTLVGCTVAPGFAFDGFEMAPLDFDPR